MDQPPDTIKQEILKIKNPKKRMICPKENIIKDDMGHGEYAQYLTGFDSARILIDDKNEVYMELPPTDPRYVLYKGECSCKTPSERKQNFLVIGPTGAGKTTLVDSFVNHILGVEKYDKFRYKLVDERQIVADRLATMAAQGQDVSNEGAA